MEKHPSLSQRREPTKTTCRTKKGLMCLSLEFQFRLLLHHLLLTSLSGRHCVYATSALGGGGALSASNCHDIHHGFDVYPNPTTLLLGQSTDTPLAEAVPPSAWKCCCWNASNQVEEVECRCEGDGLNRVPQTLKLPIQRLTIASAGLPRLRHTGLKVYGPTLLDV
ncbi:uncharacterized protein Dyak_GE15006, partial [Drosophila yakuba]